MRRGCFGHTIPSIRFDATPIHCIQMTVFIAPEIFDQKNTFLILPFNLNHYSIPNHHDDSTHINLTHLCPLVPFVLQEVTPSPR